MSAFSESDQQAIESLYHRLQSLQTAFEEVGYDGSAARKLFDSLLNGGQWQQLMKLARAINHGPQSQVDQKVFSQVRHDIRGGALTQLLGVFQLAERGHLQDKEVSKSYLRIRDHTKIMRNALPDLDPERYQRDLGEKIHHVDLLVEKWSHTRLFDDHQVVKVQVHCDFSGPVSDRCVEFSALDRVVYNLINNATHRTADGMVNLYITAGEQEHHSNLLIAVTNQVDKEQSQTLQTEFGGNDLSALMSGGFTTDGHGIGMRICSDFVAFAYGVSTRDTIEDGYVGAKLVNNNFVSWVHWPIFDQ